jgi:hypothetical protein
MGHSFLKVEPGSLVLEYTIRQERHTCAGTICYTALVSGASEQIECR